MKTYLLHLRKELLCKRAYKKNYLNGFTLIEMICVISILFILSTISIVGYQNIIKKSEGVNCLSNMRGLYICLNNIYIDKGHWPQLPKDIEIGSIDEHKFWTEIFAEYNIDEQKLRCSSLERSIKNTDDPELNAKIHYLPSIFDKNPMGPKIWDVPWATEIGDVHGNGNRVLFSDGSIKTYKEIFESMLKSNQNMK